VECFFPVLIRTRANWDSCHVLSWLLASQDPKPHINSQLHVVGTPQISLQRLDFRSLVTFFIPFTSSYGGQYQIKYLENVTSKTPSTFATLWWLYEYIATSSKLWSKWACHLSNARWYNLHCYTIDLPHWPENLSWQTPSPKNEQCGAYWTTRHLCFQMWPYLCESHMMVGSIILDQTRSTWINEAFSGGYLWGEVS
jgi:hypothetical protein